jgi:hypothetical protein
MVSIRLPVTPANTVELREWIDKWFINGSFVPPEFHLFVSLNRSDYPYGTSFVEDYLAQRVKLEVYMCDLIGDIRWARESKSEVCR